MIKKLIFNTAKEQFRKALRTHKASVRRNKKSRGLTPIMDYGLLKNKVKRDIKNTKFMDKAAYKAAPKTRSIPKGGPRPRLFGKAYASDKAGKRSMLIPMMTKKERAANQEAISQSVRKFMKERIGRKAAGGVMVKKMLVGGLLTKGIKYGYKQYRKAGGRSIIEIMRSGIKGAGKRSDAKTDVKFGIKMHGGSKLTTRDKTKLR
jgi:hypothetical protein|tara:strand:- start:745 stop:1359 length:615 start_codon:yes stop_codon:yes gene_type:complete